jgi:hypothetical protein
MLTIKLTKTAQRYTHLRTVVSEGNVGQSTNKQHRPGRGVVEIASGFPALSLQPPFFCAAQHRELAPVKRTTPPQFRPSYILLEIGSLWTSV